MGKSGLIVSRFALGTAMFGARGNADRDEVTRMMHTALDAGINLIDTADIYGRGESEEIVGAAVSGRRHQVVLSTKFYTDAPGWSANSRRSVMTAVEQSLRRLQSEWIDLYQIHRPDPACPLEETIAALDDLVRAGKVRYFGTSNFPSDLLVEAQWAAARIGAARPASEESPYSIFSRGVEATTLPACARHGIGFLAFSPLNAGWLTGKYRAGASPPADSRASRFADARSDADEGAGYWRPFFAANALNDQKLTLVDALDTRAHAAGLSLVQLAQAWVVEHPGVTSAIIGPRTPEQLDELLANVDLRLDTDLLDAVDELVPPGADVNAAKMTWTPPGLEVGARRGPR